MNVSKLEKLILESKLSKTDICGKCGFTRPTLDNVLAGADVKMSTIVSLSNFFNIPIGYLFDEEINNEMSIELDNCKKEIQQLKEMINKNASSPKKFFFAIDLDDDEFVNLGLKDKIIQVLNK